MIRLLKYTDWCEFSLHVSKVRFIGRGPKLMYQFVVLDPNNKSWGVKQVEAFINFLSQWETRLAREKWVDLFYMRSEKTQISLPICASEQTDALFTYDLTINYFCYKT